MITGSPRIDVMTGYHPNDQMCSALGLPRETPSVELGYELLRAVTWASTAGRVPVSTRTLLDRVMDADSIPSEGDFDQVERRRTLRDQLEELAIIGDIAALGSGQWLSVPGSVVQLAGPSGGGLLISGIPLLRLGSKVRPSIHLSGATRRFSDISIAAHLALPLIGLDDWIGRPRQPLLDWTGGCLSRHLSPAPASFDRDSVKIYYPGRARRGARQAERWFDLDAEIYGRHLARTSVLGESNHFHIVDIAHGEILGLSGELSHDVPRLMYGLDARDSNPTVARWSNIDTGGKLRVDNSLPSAETRAMVALAGPPRDRTWTIRRDVVAARQLLTDLGIQLESHSTSTTPNASRRKANPQQRSRR